MDSGDRLPVHDPPHASYPDDWHALALDQHRQVRIAFERADRATEPDARDAALDALCLVLNGHAIAEELVLYPALVLAGSTEFAELAYAEQTTIKIQMAQLRSFDPADPAWPQALASIREDVLNHMRKEELTWLADLLSRDVDHDELARQFREEFDRYTRPR